MNRFTAAAALVFCLAQASAAAAAGVGVDQAKLTSIHVENGVPFLYFNKTISNPDGCAAVSVITLPLDLSNHNAYLSMAMTALTTGKTLTVYVSGCGYAPWGNPVPKAYALRFFP